MWSRGSQLPHWIKIKVSVHRICPLSPSLSSPPPLPPSLSLSPLLSLSLPPSLPPSFLNLLMYLTISSNVHRRSCALAALYICSHQQKPTSMHIVGAVMVIFTVCLRKFVLPLKQAICSEHHVNILYAIGVLFVLTGTGHSSVVVFFVLLLFVFWGGV